MVRAFILLLLTTCSFVGAQTLTVFAASSLTDAFSEIASTFESQHAGVRVILNFAGSSILSTQILQGARADLFASADSAQLERVTAAGLTVTPPRIFTSNKLIAITPAGSDLHSLKDLSRPGLLLVLSAPEVPAGHYALELLQNLTNLYGDTFPEAVLANVVSLEPNVRQTAAKVALGEADAAIIYRSDALNLQNVQVIEVPEPFTVTARYPIARLRDSRHPDIAEAFIEFVLSPAGQEILIRRGFVSPP